MAKIIDTGQKKLIMIIRTRNKVKVIPSLPKILAAVIVVVLVYLAIESEAISKLLFVPQQHLR